MVANEHGQSTIEILIALPLFLTLIGLTIKANQAIQVSLVNQKYARAQALRLASNSPVFPELRFRLESDRNDFARGTIDRMIIGVSDDIPGATQGVFAQQRRRKPSIVSAKTTPAIRIKRSPLYVATSVFAPMLLYALSTMGRSQMTVCSLFVGVTTDE